MKEFKPIIVFYLFLIPGFFMFSQNSENGEYNADIDFHLLCNTDILHTISFDADWHLFEVNLAFFRVLKRSNADEIFKNLIVNSTTIEGKMYGLAGLIFCNKWEEYYKEKEKIVGGLITISIGDVITDINVGDVLSELESGVLLESIFWRIDFKKLTIK
jgi:hypothetical protein